MSKAEGMGSGRRYQALLLKRESAGSNGFPCQHVSH